MSEELNSTASVVPELVPDQVLEPVTGQALEPVTGQVLEPVSGQALEPVSGQALEPVSGQALEPVSNQVLEPVPDQVLEPLADKLSEQLAEKVSDKAAGKVSARGVVSAKESKGNDRPFRVKLRGSVLALVRLPNKRSVRAAIHQLSTTGGVIHLEKPLDEKLEVEMIFHIHEVTIRGKAQMLFPMWATQGWMQPFRFVGLSDAGRVSLDATLKSFLGEVVKGAGAGA
jgi:hypothetical protein